MTLRGRLFLSSGLILVLSLALTGVFIVARDHREWRRFLENGNLSLASFTTTDLVRRYGTFYRSEDPARRAQFTDQINLLFSYNRDLVELAVIRRGEYLFRARRSAGGMIVDPPARPEAANDPVAERVAATGRREIHSHEAGAGFSQEIHAPAFGEGGGGDMVVRYRFGDATLKTHAAELASTLLGIGVMVLAVGLLIAAVLARRISRPLKELVPLTERVASGDYAARVAYRSRDEIGTLVEAFNRMAAGLMESKRSLERLGEQLVRSEKLATVGQMAAGLSHELDNPLGVIKGFAERIRASLPEGDPRREEVGIILEEALRCRRLIGSLLDYSRGGMRRRETVHVASLVDASLSFLTTLKPFESVTATVSLPPDLPPLLTDPDRFRQVLVNLMINACHAMPRGGTITVRGGVARRTGELPIPSGTDPGIEYPILWIEVNDTGEGIPEAIRDRIFEPLFSTKAAGEGTGLGLSICQKIVEEEEGGRLTFATRMGAGTSFFILLPVKGER